MPTRETSRWGIVGPKNRGMVIVGSQPVSQLVKDLSWWEHNTFNTLDISHCGSMDQYNCIYLYIYTHILNVYNILGISEDGSISYGQYLMDQFPLYPIVNIPWSISDGIHGIYLQILCRWIPSSHLSRDGPRIASSNPMRGWTVTSMLQCREPPSCSNWT
jgi:hypothetical protein